MEQESIHTSTRNYSLQFTAYKLLQPETIILIKDIYQHEGPVLTKLALNNPGIPLKILTLKSTLYRVDSELVKYLLTSGFDDYNFRFPKYFGTETKVENELLLQLWVNYKSSFHAPITITRFSKRVFLPGKTIRIFWKADLFSTKMRNPSENNT